MFFSSKIKWRKGKHEITPLVIMSMQVAFIHSTYSQLFLLVIGLQTIMYACYLVLVGFSSGPRDFFRVSQGPL